MRLESLRLMLSLVLKSLGSLVDLLALMLLLGGVFLKFLGQIVNLRRVVAGRGRRLNLGIGGLIQVAKLELVLLRVIQQLRRSGRGRIQRTVVLLVGRRRRWVMRHLGQHPVFDLEL